VGFKRGEALAQPQGLSQNLVLQEISLRLELGPHLGAKGIHLGTKGRLLGTEGIELRFHRRQRQFGVALIAVDPDGQRLQVRSDDVLEDLPILGEGVIRHMRQ
jgi:hypothetical protein